MPNLRMLANKLQMALVQRGRRIAIQQFQTYSEKSGRMVTRYVCAEKRPNGKRRVLFESWQLAEVLQYLAEELNAGDGEDTC